MAQDEENNNNNKWYLLNRLKTIVKKVTFLMNSNINRWRVISSLTGGVGGRSFRRRLSFGEKLGLTAIVSSDEEEQDYDYDDDVDSLEVCDSTTTSSSSRELKKTKSLRVERTTSFREEDDIDKRAEMFIENFYRQLRYEKQVSLQIRNTRHSTSFGSSSSNSNSPS